MNTRTVCRICKTEGVRLHCITNTHLQELYEKETHTLFTTEDKKPMLACIECCDRLQHCYQLRNGLQQEENMSTMMTLDPQPQIGQNDIYQNNECVVQSEVEKCVKMEPEQWSDVEVKQEITTVTDNDIKWEVDSDNFDTDHGSVPRIVKVESVSDNQNEPNVITSIQAFDEPGVECGDVIQYSDTDTLHNHEPSRDIPLKTVRILSRRCGVTGLAEAINTATNTTKTAQWTVAARKRPCKRSTANATATSCHTKQGSQGQTERSRPNRRARREALQAKNKPDRTQTATAAVETQREPVEIQEANKATDKQTRRRPKTRGHRGRRIAAQAPTAPQKEQPGIAGGSDVPALVKRPRLDDTQSPKGDAKREKTDARTKRAVSYADASKSHLRVAITTVPPRDLSSEQAEQLKKTIDDAILECVLTPQSSGAPAPSFRGRPFLTKGLLAMWCEDDNALKWLEKSVTIMKSPIPDTTLTVIKMTDVNKKLRAGLLLHTRITDSATLQRVLRAQNPWYKVDSWQCFNMTVDDKDGNSKEKVVHLILGIPEDQRQTILDRDRRVAHMTGSGYIRFFSTADLTTTAPTEDMEHDGTVIPTPTNSAPQPGTSELATRGRLCSSEDYISDEDGILRSP